MAIGYGNNDDTASTLESEFRALALKTQRESRLVVNNNETGLCQHEDCGLPIPAARLLAIPGAKFCIECQSKAERSVSQH